MSAFSRGFAMGAGMTLGVYAVSIALGALAGLAVLIFYALGS